MGCFVMLLLIVSYFCFSLETTVGLIILLLLVAYLEAH